MLDAATLLSVDKVLRTLRRRPMMAEQPFGGLQVIFVGDFFQLPPVSRDKSATFAFESPAWQEANPIICYLNEQHRQEDADFLDLLSAMRSGSITAAHRTRLKSRAGIESKKAVATRLYTHNENVDRINAESLEKIAGAKRAFQMTSRGARALVEALKVQCLSPETLELKEGASVMFTRNNFEAGYVNGTLGTVTGFNSLGAPIVKTRHSTQTVEPAEWAIQDGNKILARITQIPLRLAWAITVHKSQGMSLDAAIIDLSQAFEFGQGYVALSRVRTLAGLFLEGFNERALEMHPKVVGRDRNFRAYSDAAKKKFASLAPQHRSALEKNFLKAIGAKEPWKGEVFSTRTLVDAKLAPQAEKPRPSAGEKLTALREKYPNAGRSWNKDDDALLTAMFNEGKKNADIAKHFGRKPSAIQARLGHFGLIENFWPKKRKN